MEVLSPCRRQLSLANWAIFFSFATWIPNQMNLLLGFCWPPKEILADSIHVAKNICRKGHILHGIVRNGSCHGLGNDHLTHKGEEVCFPSSKAILHPLNNVPKILINTRMFDWKTQVFTKRGDRPEAQYLTQISPIVHSHIRREENSGFFKTHLLSRETAKGIKSIPNNHAILAIYSRK